MDEESPLFILAGIRPGYTNRGCEAIVRGTTKILRKHFRDPHFLCLNHIESEEQYQQQCLQEMDEAITHLHSYRPSKRKIAQNFWKPSHLGYVYDYFRRPEALKYRIYKQTLPYLDNAVAVLSVGGDNYSLDYGIPTLFTGLDDIVLEKKKPLAIWGASVGPFDTMPDYERYMSHHLREVPGIFARESVTIGYLKSIGVTENVYPVADPAFLMDPVKPEGIEDVLPIDEEAIGLNLSPLMAKYVSGGDIDAWTTLTASIIESVAKKIGVPVYLIPHVTNPGSNDHEFMQRALSLIKDRNGNITLVPPEYNAAETKWIISRMALFAGARTHSTIAALSSGIPTLSFAYSIKAQGINRDIFGHTDYCMEPTDLGAEAVVSRVTSILDESATIRNDLAARIPGVQRAALSAGMELKHLIGEN
ncbi:polysaccharide pyruvyl transferase family protein [Methanoculleus sp. YWC-01]|uniref:Polysaccharide pyruvyl transferase family protein n=1 Tax=Methanoculleus nereidis TaxID=2735141 RepID=A0ABU3Z2P6_9EURY|nr:polysaccharide pyruvyl transferase family protein [Methanoculleus sp. YWC-01]MDV4343092.1 polysaccharide pyruvyl transferase family protein [Methanoculleus sp. YWC-01]